MQPTVTGWLPEGEELERILDEQGRKVEWFADAMRISRTYLFRIRVRRDNRLARPDHQASGRVPSACWRSLGRITSKTPKQHRRVTTRYRRMLEERLVAATA